MTFRTLYLQKAHRKAKHTKPKAKPTFLNYDRNEQSNSYKCNTCGKEFYAEVEIKEHMTTHDFAFVCKICSQTFDNSFDYSVHMYQYNKDFYACPMENCKYQTKYKSIMLQHSNFHINKFYYNCHVCKKGFQDKNKFNEHLENHKSGKMFTCVVCNKEFLYSTYLTAHQMRYHTVRIEGIALPNQCTLCNKSFSSEKNLHSHRLWHEQKKGRKELCAICGKSYHSTKMRQHMREHTGEKPFRCSFCDKAFRVSYALTTHRRIHTGERPYVCEHCGKTFNQGGPLRVHLRSHTGETPYSCLICNSKFKAKSTLKSHMISCGNN